MNKKAEKMKVVGEYLHVFVAFKVKICKEKHNINRQ